MAKTNFRKKLLALVFMGSTASFLTSCSTTLTPKPSIPSISISPSVYDENNLTNAPATFVSKTLTYTGSLLTLSVTDFSESGTSIQYKITDSESKTTDGNGAIKVGTYTITASFLSKKTNLKVYKDLTALLTIVPADYPEVTSVKLFSDGIYKYEKGVTHSLEVIDSKLLEEFDVSYEETNQNKEDVGVYQVKTTFTSKSKNYQTFSKLLTYKIVDDSNLHEVNLLNPYDDLNTDGGNSVISLGYISGDMTYKQFFAENEDLKARADKICRYLNLLYPYGQFSWSFNENDYVRTSNPIVVATPSAYTFRFNFPQGSGAYVKNGNLSFIPYTLSSATKQMTINGVKKTITYNKLVATSGTYNLLDVELELNGHNVKGFYFNKEYTDLVFQTKFTAANFNTDNSSEALIISDHIVNIYVQFA